MTQIIYETVRVMFFSRLNSLEAHKKGQKILDTVLYSSLAAAIASENFSCTMIVV